MSQSKTITNKRILITGGAGSIGTELVRQLCNKNKLYILDTNETGLFDLLEELRLQGKNVVGRVGDIRNIRTLEEVFFDFEPDIAFHVAALKHVTPNEWNPREAVETNVLGTLNLLSVAKIYGLKKLVNISTDKVVNAESIMGATKKLAEKAVRNAGYVSVRFGNVMGSRGSLLTIWEKQHAEKRPLTITNLAMERYFMTIPQAVSLVIKASLVAKPKQVLILDMGKKQKIIDVKKELYGDYPIKVIGIRDGETLSEELMTPDEQARAFKQGNLWIL